jgi:hypothetical protein
MIEMSPAVSFAPVQPLFPKEKKQYCHSFVELNIVASTMISIEALEQCGLVQAKIVMIPVGIATATDLIVTAHTNKPSYPHPATTPSADPPA